jgi:hypothetical protein
MPFGGQRNQKIKNMTKLRIIIGLFLLSSLTVFGQKKNGLAFDIQDFNQKATIAEWLYLYDAIAWWTSDSVMTQSQEELQRLGSEWFCFQTEDGNWHAAYGKYENNEMNVVFHYLVDTTYKVSRTFEPIEAEFLNLHARALITANNQITAIRDSNQIRFNQYIKQNEDRTFTVWIFPAFQPNGLAVHGGEFIYKIDPTGTKILEDNSYFQGQFRAFKVDNPREVWMDYTELEKPTLGSIFFIWYYKKYFTYIKLDNKNYVTTTIKSGDGSYSWMHIEKEQEKKKGKKK